MNEQCPFSWGAICKIFVGIVALYVLYQIKAIIVWFVFALIIGILFNFLIDFLEKKKVPRLLAAILLYFGVFALLGLFIYQAAPIFLSEIKEFTQNLPHYLQRISPTFEKFGIQIFQNTETFIQTIKVSLEKASQNIFSALFSVFGGAFASLFIIFLAFFISLESNFIGKIVNALAPAKYKDYLLHDLWQRSKKKVSGWFLSRLIGALFVGALSYVVLRIFNVEYAFVLSVITGLFDFVPIIGPLMAGAIIFLIVALSSFTQALFVLIAFVVVQQLENNFVFPLLFKKFVGLPPVLVLVALAIGGKVWGILGAILAIPLIGVIFEFLKDYLAKTRGKELTSDTSLDL